jgi:hypothetical protein
MYTILFLMRKLFKILDNILALRQSNMLLRSRCVEPKE